MYIQILNKTDILNLIDDLLKVKNYVIIGF